MTDVTAPRRQPLGEGWASPASLEQERVWNDERAGVATGAYNLFAAFEITGPLHLASLIDAVGRLSARHDVLRTTFSESDKVLEQIVWDRAVPPEIVDLSEMAPDQADASVADLLDRERSHRFDLSGDTLFRTAIVRRSRDRSLLVVNAHHILVDEWSLALLMAEVTRYYAGSEPAGPTSPQYADYAQWQRLRGGWPQRDVDFWRGCLADRHLCRLPATAGWAQRDRASDSAGVPLHLSVDDLYRVARQAQVTPHTLGLTALALALRRLGGPDATPVIVLPVANRSPELMATAGLFVNLLPVAFDVDRAAGPQVALRHVATAESEALRHQALPLSEIARASGRAGADLLDVVYHFEDGSRKPSLQLEGCTVRLHEIGAAPAQFDLTVGLEITGDTAQVVARYNAARYTRRTVQTVITDMAAFLATLVGGATETFGAPPNPGAEAAVSVSDQTSKLIDPLDGVLDWASRGPDRCAVRWSGGSWSYADLLTRVGTMAGQLADVPAGQPIGLLAQSGPDAVAAILAATWVGRAYVPLNPDEPADRLAGVVARAGIGVVFVDAETKDRLPAGVVGIDIRGPGTEAEHAPRVEVPLGAPLAVMHTSGSTGFPKGVVVTRHNVANLIAQDFVTLGAGRCVVHAAPLAFDASTFEIWCALAAGATIAIIETDTATDPHSLKLAISLLGARTMFVTTSLFNHLARLDPTVFDGLDDVITGGERASTEAFRSVYRSGAGPRLLHAYGPTETTTFTSIHRVTAADIAGPELSLGRPLRGASTYLLDHRLHELPLGFAGRLFVGGLGVTDGYQGAPRLTAERFLPDPCSRVPGGRMYDSGDHVRSEPDGRLMFIGRGDRQVKIRGHRVELAEIETAAADLPGAMSAVAGVQALSNGDDQIWVVIETSQLNDPDAVRGLLAKVLPPFAVPGRVVLLNAWPLTASGKFDASRALASPSADAVTIDVDPVARIVRHAWTEALGHPPLDENEHFYTAGGNSLSAVRLLDAISEQTEAEVSIRSFLLDPRFGMLCDQIRAAAATAAPDALDEIFAQFGAGHE